MFLRLNFKQNGDFALLAPCARADVPVLEYLLNELNKLWKTPQLVPADGYETLSKHCLLLIDKVISLLPRVDCEDQIEVGNIKEPDLVRNFVISVSGERADLTSCQVLLLHTFTPLPPVRNIPKLEDEITTENVPLQSSGDADADLLASLVCLTDGDVLSAQLIYDNWDAERIDRFLFAYGERKRDPEERKADYMCKLFDQWKRKNQEVLDQVRFRHHSSDLPIGK